MTLPYAFSILPAETDWSGPSYDMAFSVGVSYFINGTVQAHGKTLLTGWHWAARTKVTFFVNSPKNEAAAREGIRAAVKDRDRRCAC